MKIESILYYGKNEYGLIAPQEDAANNVDNVFVVADGVTHELVDGIYPIPSASGEVATIIVNTIVEELKDSHKELGDIKKAIRKANEKVLEYTKITDLYKNREENGYNIGAAVLAVVVINQGKLVYAVLDDCYFSIFSSDLVDHPMLKSYVDLSAKYFFSKYEETTYEAKKAWKKDIRNHSTQIEGKTIGYGALDGRDGYEQFLQTGEETLKPGDLICLYTDGFMPHMRDIEFIKKIKNEPFSEETLKYIDSYSKEKEFKKEKTCYFIKYSD